MMKQNKNQLLCRAAIYGVGVIILAIGVASMARSTLGLLPVSAPPFGLSKVLGASFSTVLFLHYCLLVGIEFLVKGKNREMRDLLQLPFSLVFSTLVGAFESLIAVNPVFWWQKGILLVIGILCTGIGISMSVQMKVVPNPADGLMLGISTRFHKDSGTAKNILDLLLVAAAFLIDILFGKIFTSVGIGTVAAMILVGRVIYVFNRLFLTKMKQAAGLA